MVIAIARLLGARASARRCCSASARRWRGVGIWIGLAVGLVVVAALLLWRWCARERLGLLAARLAA